VLDGKPFPAKPVFEPVLPKPGRTFFVSPAGPAAGNGGEKRPWKELQAALKSLRPGDRLVLLPGEYLGPFRVDETCRDGTAEAPIQVIGRERAVLRSFERSAVLSVAKAHWIFQGLQIAPGVSSQAPGFATVGLDAHDIVFDRGSVSDGRGPGVLIASGSRRVTISNSRIHNFRGGGPRWSHGVLIYSQTGEIQLAGNALHDNEGSSVFVEGARGRGKGMRSYIEGLSIVGNTFRDDGMHGVKVRGAARALRITHNEFRGYRPSRNSRGSAVLMYPTTREAVVEDNAITDTTVGVHLGASDFEGPGKGIGPLNIAIQRNYIACGALAESMGIRVDSGRRVRINNNVIQGCEEALRLDALPPEGEGLSVANNLVLEPTRLAFSLSSPAAAAFFGNNVFSVRSGKVGARLGGETRDLRKSWKGFAMPGTSVTTGVTLAGHDLARITGVRVVDAGTTLQGIAYKGAAPDIGIAEK
jgi:nitrous oxidase accessory protein NosD